jgi:uncharacterized RDD family membrane protein YckC
MAEDQPGPPGRGDQDDQPTRPLDTPPGPTAPLPGDRYAPPPAMPPAGGPPPEALGGFWRRLAGAFIDWLLVGILASAIGALFGIGAPSPPPARGDGFQFEFDWTGPYILVELAYFTYFHATSAGQSIGNKILGIRVLDAQGGGSLPYIRAFVRALMSNISALPCFLGFFWMLWDPRKRTWHDMVADSLVVRASAYPPGEFGRPAR